MGCGSEDDTVEQPSSNNSGSCNNAGCTSGGCQSQQQPQGSFGSWARRQQTAIRDSTSAASAAGQDVQLGTCRKCKQRPAVLHIRQQEPYCNECLEAGIQQKVRTATKTQGLVQTGDHVMVAVSGGAASLALLACIVEMKSTNPSRPERGKVPFQLTVVHIDSTAVLGTQVQEGAEQLLQLQAAVAAAGYQGTLLVVPLAAVYADQEQLQQQLQPMAVQQLHEQMQALHVSAKPEPQQQQDQHLSALSAESVDSSTAGAAEQLQQQQQQLLELVSSICDTTGKEDLINHMQEQLLLRTAVALGCNRLLLGECASRVAAKIIADAAKGRGYSLPADIQLLDARSLPQGGPVIIHPIQEVTYRELVAFCVYKGITWRDRALGQPILQQQSQQGVPNSSRGSGKACAAAMSVNTLAEKFIADMQSSVPGSIYPILRTAAHLQQFGFNDILAVPEAANASLPPSARAARAKHLAQQQEDGDNGSNSAADGMQGPGLQPQLCSICRAPLPSAAAATAAVSVDRAGGDAAAAAEARLRLAGLTGSHSKQLCYSCNRQILFHLNGPAGEGATEVGNNLEARMQRLKQLLPPGVLLVDD